MVERPGIDIPAIGKDFQAAIAALAGKAIGLVPLGRFVGRSDIDQLFKIFQRRGTPTAEMWPAVLRLPHYNAEFPQWREKNITDFVPLQGLGGTTGADLLQKLLLYDPDRRIACKTALQHPYFMQQD